MHKRSLVRRVLILVSALACSVMAYGGDLYLTRATTWSGCLMMHDSWCEDVDSVMGIITVKVGKTNARTGLSKVTATVTYDDGSKQVVRGQTDSRYFSGGRLSLYLGEDYLSGRVNGMVMGLCDAKNVFGHRAGANIPYGSRFSADIWVPCCTDRWDVVPRDVPVNVLSSWKTPKAGKVKVVRGGLSVSPVNPCGVKLSFKRNAGTFTGKFTTYSYHTGGKLKKTKYSVKGAIAEGVGYGFATARGQESVLVSVKP